MSRAPLRRIRTLLGALVAAAASAATAGAVSAEAVRLAQMTSGYTYYNRPGASGADHVRDVTDCAKLAGSARSVDAILAAEPLAQVWGERVGQRVDRELATASLENCMVVRGWRVVRLTESEGRALAPLPAAELGEKLAPWIGAPAPHGKIVRRWDNDAARRSSERYGSGPRTKNGQLSLLAAAPELRQLPPPSLREPPSPWTNPLWPRKPIEAEALARVRPDAGVLLIELKGDGFGAGWGLTLNRVGADPQAWPSLIDHAPDQLVVQRLSFFHHGVAAYVLPPGRWRLYGLGMTPKLNLCLGSPSFELHAGEVLYAGSFDLSAADFTPDMDLAPARAWLGPAAGRVTAAAYTNGFRGPCGDNSIYALEFTGAPFAGGYDWGSRAAPATPVP